MPITLECLLLPVGLALLVGLARLLADATAPPQCVSCSCKRYRLFDL